jgi:hypothetical protein
LDPTTSFIIGVTPLPNNFNVGDGLNVARLRFRRAANGAPVRLHDEDRPHFNDRHSMYVRWAHGAQNTLGDNANGGLQKFPWHSQLCRHLSAPRNLAVNYRWTISPTVVNEFVTGFNRFTFSFNNPDPVENPPVILNVPNDPLNLEEPINNLRTITTWQFVDNLSFIHNAHMRSSLAPTFVSRNTLTIAARWRACSRASRIFLSTGINPCSRVV